MQHGHVFQERHLEDSRESEGGIPHPPFQIPIGLGEVFGGESTPFFDHQNAVTFLRQTMSGNTSPKARADNDPIIMLLSHKARPDDSRFLQIGFSVINIMPSKTSAHQPHHFGPTGCGVSVS